MNQHERPTKGFLLSLVAGILIISNAALLGTATTWFPGAIPTLPGSSANDPGILYRLTAIGLIVGVLVFLGAILLRIKPVNRKTWGVMIIGFSIPSFITGGGFIVGLILGIIGGAFALRRNPEK
ncbi:MAG TPA: DUF6114 domain-containing protein [Candidatus Thermoplasmatota archaeon]|nr:DUF6114 domain-containing protein [Candidatus Thermoplasmatota archaeon]